MFIYIYTYFLNKDYERLCRSLNSLTETSQQIKLLWGTLIKRNRNNPDNINSSMISKVWKELCMNKNYSHICHFEKTFNDKIEQVLDNYSKRMKSKQLNSKSKGITSPKSINTNFGISENKYQNTINNNNNENNNNCIPLINTMKSSIVYLSPTTPMNPSIVTPITPTNPTIVIPTTQTNTSIVTPATPTNVTIVTSATEINNAPINITPVNTTLVNTTPVNTTPINTTPVNITPINTTQIITNNTNFNNVNNNVNNVNSQNFNYSCVDNQFLSPVTNIVSPIAITDNSINQNNIQIATIPITNEINYIPAYQPQYIVNDNNNNQIQNIIIY